ncbi:MAG: hypothetical protein HZC40_20950 [Chloroflexi bacterium]|nr:hypothetical protein [Chloroflexota bacterium]
MPNSHCIVVYGNSLALAGIAIALRHNPALKVVTIETDSAKSAEQLGAIGPDVIIFDRAQADANLLARAQQRGVRLVIGVDANSDQMLLYTAQRSRATTMQDLARAIDGLVTEETHSLEET